MVGSVDTHVADYPIVAIARPDIVVLGNNIAPRTV
jgi:hypothetical protein